MSPERARPDANRCFVCGPDNPAGLRLGFVLDAGQVCRADFTPGPNHAGYDQLTHGGLIFSALDDVMANWLFLKGIRAHTARCEIRYRQPLRIGTPIRLEGRLVRRKGNLAIMQGLALRADDGSVVAEAEGTFMIVPGDSGPGG